MESQKYLADLESLQYESLDDNWKEDFVRKVTEHRVEGSLIEATCAAEFISRYIFDERNVPDDLFRAYDAAFTNSQISLHEHFADMVQKGEGSVQGFVSNLKGKLFELKLEPKLEDTFPNFDFSISDNPVNQIWDLIGVNNDTGEQILVQAKMGASAYASDVIERMYDNPNVYFALSEDLADKIINVDPDLADQILDYGVNSSDFTEGTELGLDTLAGNMGIDIPDEVGEILPYVTELVLAIRFLFDIIKVNKDYKNVGASDKTKLYAFKLIMLMSRFGVSSVCVPLGGVIGTAIPVPVIGTIGGAVAGAWFASKVNKSLKPKFEELSLWLLGLDNDDLFYFRNKVQIDLLGESFLQATNSA